MDLGLGEQKSRPHYKKQGSGCDGCGLYRYCQSPQMPPTGKGKKRILIVGEAPGKMEDQKGIQFIGKSGYLLRETLSNLGYDLERDCWKTNALLCQPPENRDPTPFELNECKKFLHSLIKSKQPDIIIPMGKFALNALIGHRITGRLKGTKFSKFVGTQIPDQELGVYICPVNHPAYILRNERDTVICQNWKAQIKSAFELSGSRPEIVDYFSKVVITTDPDKAIEWISFIKQNWKKFAFDYETTGRKPQREGHKIWTTSVSNGKVAYAWPMYKAQEKLKRAWIDLLESDVGLIAHHTQFEHIWSRVILDAHPNNWIWDTMTGAHMEYNKRPNNLKFRTYENFGVIGYDDEINQFLSKPKPGEDPKSANSFNRIDEAPLPDLLTYNALDSLFTYKLYLKQSRILDGKRRAAADFFFSGGIELANTHINGIKVKDSLLNHHINRLTTKKDELYNKIFEFPEAKKAGRKFKPTSNPELNRLLYNTLGYKGTGVDDKALTAIGTPFVKSILEYRKTAKLVDTYLDGFRREVVDGFIHPYFNLNTVDTFRSSSDTPNFQNIPKRDKKAMKIVRSFLIPNNGRIIEYDYKALEVVIAGCVYKDPNWLSYCRDTSKDMHRDTAIEILYYQGLWDKLEPSIAKTCRQASKNGYVFPSIYGSSGENAAYGMWEQLPEETKKHLKKHGIYGVQDFVNRMIEYEDEYWNKRYPVYGHRRNEAYKLYEKKGYVDTVTGFRCYGPLDFTQVVNYKVQGPASHVKLWTMDKVSKQLRAEGMKSYPLGEIHDAILFNTNSDEEEKLDQIVWRFGTQEVREEWKWIIAPLLLEKDRSEINGRWSDMESCGYLEGKQ